jgi:hypothetical protein
LKETFKEYAAPDEMVAVLIEALVKDRLVIVWFENWATATFKVSSCL